MLQLPPGGSSVEGPPKLFQPIKLETVQWRVGQQCICTTSTCWRVVRIATWMSETHMISMYLGNDGKMILGKGRVKYLLLVYLYIDV